MTKFASSRPKRPRYATKAIIDRTVEAARANGIRVTSLTFGPDGTLKLSAIEEQVQRPASLFDALDKEGRL